MIFLIEFGNLSKKNKGKAYGFFNSDAKTREIETNIPTIRKCVNTPGKMELELINGVENLRGDRSLMEIAYEARISGINYVIEGRYPNATNSQTADELSLIINQLYLLRLTKQGEYFRGSIAFEDNGTYIFRE